MLAALATVVTWIVGLFLKRPPAPKPEERVGRAEANLESERIARAQTSQAIDARRAADAQRLRNTGSGPVTTDRGADINADDGFRRD